MIVFYIMVICFLVATFGFFYKQKRHTRVPGPYGLPIIGYYPFLRKNPNKIIFKLSQQYGRIFKLHILGQDYYFLNDLQLLKEAFVTHGDHTTGRSEEFNLVQVFVGNSLSATTGEKWYQRRRFLTKALAKLVGNTINLENKIILEVEKLVLDIEKTNGNDHDFHDNLSKYSSSFVLNLLCGKEFDSSDPDHLQLQYDCSNFVDYFEGLDLFYAGPWFQLISRLMPRNKQILAEIHERVKIFFFKLVDERLTSYNEHAENDVLDYYIGKLLKDLRKQDEPLTHNRETIADMMFGNFLAAELMVVVIYYALFVMAKRRDIQKRIQIEIDEIIGSRQITLRDQPRCHYTMAFLNEIQRCADVFPFGLPHMATKEIKVGGYTIPAKAHLVGNLTNIMKDERYFTDAKGFNPSNFLDEHGNFKKNHANVAFSMGSRGCPGTNIANSESFISFATLMQKFTFLPAKETMTSTERKEIIFPRLKRYKIRALKN